MAALNENILHDGKALADALIGPGRSPLAGEPLGQVLNDGNALADYILLGKLPPRPTAAAQKPIKPRGVIAETASALASGLVSTAEGIGGAMEMLGVPGGRKIREEWQAIGELEALQRPTYLQQDDTIRARDWRWWVRNIGENIPNFVMMYGTGGAVGAGAKIAGAGMKAIRAAAMAGGFGGSFTMEGGSQYAQTKQEMQREGKYTPEEIERVATMEGMLSGTVNAIIEMVPMGNVFGKEAVQKHILKRILQQGVLEGSTEVLQEAVNVWSEKLGHKPDQKWSDQVNRMLTAGIVGGVMGGVVAGPMGHAYQKQQAVQYNTAADQLALKEDIYQWKDAGLTDTEIAARVETRIKEGRERIAALNKLREDAAVAAEQVQAHPPAGKAETGEPPALPETQPLPNIPEIEARDMVDYVLYGQGKYTPASAPIKEQAAQAKVRIMAAFGMKPKTAPLAEPPTSMTEGGMVDTTTAAKDIGQQPARDEAAAAGHAAAVRQQGEELFQVIMGDITRENEQKIELAKQAETQRLEAEAAAQARQEAAAQADLVAQAQAQQQGARDKLTAGDPERQRLFDQVMQATPDAVMKAPEFAARGLTVAPAGITDRYQVIVQTPTGPQESVWGLGQLRQQLAQFRIEDRQAVLDREAADRKHASQRMEEERIRKQEKDEASMLRHVRDGFLNQGRPLSIQQWEYLHQNRDRLTPEEIKRLDAIPKPAAPPAPRPFAPVVGQPPAETAEAETTAALEEKEPEAAAGTEEDWQATPIAGLVLTEMQEQLRQGHGRTAVMVGEAHHDMGMGDYKITGTSHARWFRDISKKHGGLKAAYLQRIIGKILEGKPLNDAPDAKVSEAKVAADILAAAHDLAAEPHFQEAAQAMREAEEARAADETPPEPWRMTREALTDALDWGAEPMAAIPGEPLEHIGKNWDKSPAALFEDEASGKYYIKRSDGTTLWNPQTKSRLFEDAIEAWDEYHRQEVRQAVADGKPVPANVREQYAEPPEAEEEVPAATPAATPAPEAPAGKTPSPGVQSLAGKPPAPARLTYEQFAAQYREAFAAGNKYTPKEAGFNVYSDKMADLADAYPEYLERLEAEEEAAAAPQPEISQKELADVRSRMRRAKELGLSIAGVEEWLGVIEAGDAAKIAKEPGVKDTLDMLNSLIARRERNLKKDAEEEAARAAAARAAEAPAKEKTGPKVGDVLSDADLDALMAEAVAETKAAAEAPAAAAAPAAAPPAEKAPSPGVQSLAGKQAAPAMTVAAATKQPSAPAKKIATLLYALGIQDSILQGEDYYRRVKNPPYMDLVIERHGREIYLTHYYQQAGDSIMDGEMIWTVNKNGDLFLKETAVQDPIRGGELRGRDERFANIFARNLVEQGFGKGTLVNPREEKTVSAPPAEAPPEEKAAAEAPPAVPPAGKESSPGVQSLTGKPAKAPYRILDRSRFSPRAVAVSKFLTDEPQTIEQIAAKAGETTALAKVFVEELVQDGVAAWILGANKYVRGSTAIDYGREEAPAEKPQEKAESDQPAFKVGDRVVLKNGRHGKVIKYDPLVMQSIYGGKRSVSHYYQVESDAGKIYHTESQEYLQPEPGIERPGVVPDIRIDNRYLEPGEVADNIQYYRQRAREEDAAAQRARKPSSVGLHRQTTADRRAQADQYQKAFDEWAAEYPEEAQKYRPVKAPAPASAGVQTLTGKPAAAEAPAAAPAPAETGLGAYGLTVTKSATNTGKTVWNVTGPETRTWKDTIKQAGGRWYRGGQAWSFYNGDPTRALLEALPPIDQVHPSIRDKYRPAPAKTSAVSREKIRDWMFNNAITGQQAQSLFRLHAAGELKDMKAREALQGKIVTVTFTDGRLRNMNEKGEWAGEVQAPAAGIPAAAPFAKGDRVVVQHGDTTYPATVNFSGEGGTSVTPDVTVQQARDLRLPGGAAMYVSNELIKPAPTLTKAAAEVAAGVGTAYDAMAEIFKAAGKPRVGSMLGTGVFDDELYEKIKPLLKETYDHFRAAALEVKAWMVETVNQFKARGIPAEAVMPYIKRYYQDQTAGLTKAETGDILTSQREGTGHEEEREGLLGGESPHVAVAAVAGASGLDAGELSGPRPAALRAGEAEGLPGPQGRRGLEEGLRPERPGPEPAGSAGDREQRPAEPAGRPGHEAGPAAGTAAGEAGGGNLGLGGEPAGRPPHRIRGVNHIIEPGDVLYHAGKVSRINANIRALELSKQIERENRAATPAEQKILAQFSGWGSVAQDVFNDSFDEYLQYVADNPRSTLASHPERWHRFDRDDAAKFQEWKQKYGNRLHPLLGGILTREEWDAAAESTLNAHYTSAEVITHGLWNAAARLGFASGRGADPAAGTGRILGLLPESLRGTVRLMGVELDAGTGRILSQLYPQADIQVTGFENAQRIPDNSLDLVISNFPFGKYPVQDSRHPAYSGWSIHNYFFARSVDAVRPGGLVIAITSRYTMDSTKNGEVREYLAQRADLVGAIRLPGTAFAKDAGTEVTTDILFLRKKTNEPYPERNDWRVVLPVQAGEGEALVNEYYLRHPEMVLGTHALTGKMFGGANEYTVTPRTETPLTDQLDAAVAHLPAGIAGEGSLAQAAAEAAALQAPINAKEGLLVRQDGKFYLVQNGQLVPPEWAGDHKKAVQASYYMPVRDRARELIAKMLDPATTDAELAEQRARLNGEYDNYVFKYGRFHERNSLYLADDEEFPVAMSLENVIRKPYEYVVKTGKHAGEKRTRTENTYVKADIFTQRTLYPFQEPSHADTIEDAVHLSLAYRNHIDADYIARILGQEPAATRAQLLAQQLAFINPATGLLESRSEYLSGNVREKLRVARENDLPLNVAALEPVQPAPLVIDEIFFRLGSEWVPPAVIERFIRDVMGTPAQVRRASVGRGDEGVTRWEVRDPRAHRRDDPHFTVWGAEGVSGPALAEDSLNLTRTDIYEPYTDDNGREQRRKNPGRSLNAQAKQAEIQAAFKSYVLSHAETAQELADIYNREKNNYVLRQYDIPTFDYYPNANHAVRLRAHQKRGVARGLQGSTIFAHAVGTGKTYLYSTLAMELKRTNQARKTLIVVQGSTVNQFAGQARTLYPAARILCPTKKERTKQERRALLARIATNNYDTIILPHSFFDDLSVSPGREQSFIREQLAEIREAIREEGGSVDRPGRNESITVKELRRILKAKQARLERLASLPHEVDAIWFEDLGVDAIMVDETHHYKRGDFYTKMGNIKGLDRGGAAKSFRFLMKARAIQERTGGKNIYLATGTSVSNTTAELWTLLRYVRPDLLQEFGAHQFDGFASVFGDTRRSLEQTETGDFKIVERFNRYVNGPELIKMWLTAADVILQEDVPGWADLVPKLRGGGVQPVALPRMPELAQYIEHIRELREEWNKLDGREKRQQSHVPLLLFNRAKQAAIDLRLVPDAAGADLPGSKANRVVQEVYQRWAETEPIKGTQLVFLDTYRGPNGFNLYHDIRDKLISQGIPAEQIAVITDNKYNNDAAKEALFERVNDGQVRVVIGSTFKLGIGVNVQERLVALHHVDAPMRPMDFEQRNGRILRPGNTNHEVEILAYSVINSLDSVSYDRLQKKQWFINQLLRGKLAGRAFEDPTDELQFTFEDLMAACAGNPLVKRRFQLENNIRELDVLQDGHQRKIGMQRGQIAKAQQDLAAETVNLTRAKTRQENTARTFPDNSYRATVDGQTYDDFKEGKKALQAAVDQITARAEAAYESRLQALQERENNPTAADVLARGLRNNAKHTIPDGWSRVVYEAGAAAGSDANAPGPGAAPERLQVQLNGVPLDIEAIAVPDAQAADVLAVKDLKDRTVVLRYWLGKKTETQTTAAGQTLHIDTSLAAAGRIKSLDGIFTSIRFALGEVAALPEKIEKRITQGKENLRHMQEQIDKPFEHAAQLEALVQEYRQVLAELGQSRAPTIEEESGGDDATPPTIEEELAAYGKPEEPTAEDRRAQEQARQFAEGDEAARQAEAAEPAASGQIITSFYNSKKMKEHADYKPAKAGDREAAARLVVDLVKPEQIQAARERFGPDAIYVAPHAIEATGENWIPSALANLYAQHTSGTVDDEIVQSIRAFHAGAGAMDRLISRPVFEGNVVQGGKYVLVDDVSTMGGTFAELAHHIQANGGQVAGIITLTNASRSAMFAPNNPVVRELERRFGNETREPFGIDPKALTAAEAGYLIGFRDADTLRNRAAKAIEERRQRLLSKGIRPSEAEVTPRYSQDQGRPQHSSNAGALGPAGLKALVEDLVRTVKGISIIERDDGLAIKTRDGQYCRIVAVEHIEPDRIVVRVGYGQVALQGKTVAGQFLSGAPRKGSRVSEIQLVRNQAGFWTLTHEFYHFLEDIGAVSNPDKALLNNKIQALIAKDPDTYGHLKKRSPGEARAEWVGQTLAGAYDAKTPTGKVLSAIRAVIDRIVNALGIRTAGGVMRDIREGRLYARPGYEAATAQYATAEGDFEKWFGEKIKKAFKQNHIYNILLDAGPIQSGPLDGGCRVLARALMRIEPGGRILTIERGFQGDEWRPDHYGYEMPHGGIIDGLGYSPSREKWLAKFRKAVGMPIGEIRNYRVTEGEIETSDIPQDAPTEKKLEETLSRELAQEAPAQYSLAEDALAQGVEQAGATIGRGVASLVGRARPDQQAGLARLVKHWNEFWRPFSTVKGGDRALAARYEAMGNVARAVRFIDGVQKQLDLYPAEVKKDIFWYLNGDLPINAIPEALTIERREGGRTVAQEVQPREMAEMLRRRTETIGEMLVARGLISEKAFQEHQGKYIHYLYAKHVLGEDAPVGLTSSGKLNLSYTIQRNPNLTMQQRKELGLIEDASVPVPVGMGKALTDIAKFDYLEKIADNPDWVWQPSVVKVPIGKKLEKPVHGRTRRYLTMSVGRLVEQVGVYNEMMRTHPSPEVAEIHRILTATLDKAQRKTGHAPEEFVQLPNSRGYGPLAGAYVLKPIADDLKPVLDVATDRGKLLNTIVEIERQGMAYFKMGKVALNVPTAVRNIVSNIIQNNMRGRALHLIPGDIVAACESMKAKDSYYDEAFGMGLFHTNWFVAEINDVLRAFRSAQGGRLDRIIGAVKDVAKYYGKIDDVSKFAIFLQLRKEGKPIDAAALEAMKWGMDYSLTSRSVKGLRQTIVPFITYQYKIAPLIAESLKKRPWVLAKFALIYPLAQMLTKGLHDLDDDDWEDLKKQLPAYIKKSGSMMVLPWRTNKGQWQWVNLEYYFPWGNYLAIARDVRAKDLGEFMRDSGLSNPFLSMFYTGLSAREDQPPLHAYFGTPIYNELDPAPVKAAKFLEYMVNTWAPSMLTRQGALGYMGKLALGGEDRWGREVTAPQALGRWFGFNIVSVSPEQTRAEASVKIQDLRKEMARIEADPSRSDEEKAAYRARLNERLAEIAQEAPAAVLPITKGKGRDPVYEALTAMAARGILHTGPPSRSVEIHGIPLKMTIDQYREYLDRSSELARARLQPLVDSPAWEQMTDQRKADVVAGIVTNARKGVRQKIKAEMLQANREKIDAERRKMQNRA